MSLVSDALRKARREAAERGEGLDPARVPTRVVVQAPPRRKLTLVTLAVVAAGCLLAGAGSAWWLARRTATPVAGPAAGLESPVAPPAAVAAATPTPVTATETGPPAAAVVERTSTPRAARPSPPPPVDSTPGEARPPEAIPQVQNGGDPPPSAPPPTPLVADEPAAGAALAPNEQLSSITVDGVELSLDYIAYIPGSPFAEINGEEVRLGSVIAGCEVVAITATAVTLELADGGRVVLRAR